MKKKALIILLLVAVILLGACSNKNNDASDNGSVKVYYINSKTSGLVSENYKLISTKTEDKIHELLYNLQKAPENAMYKSALPADTDNMEDTDITFNFDQSKEYLTVDFNASYDTLSQVAQVLCRAVIVKTLSQLEEVTYIQFSREGQLLKDFDGKAVGIFTADSFIDNIEDSTYYKVKLYFANKAGNKLIEYTTELNYSGTQSVEELVINQLINGPTEAGMYRTIPEGTVLLNISKADHTCTVDFNSKFMDKIPDIDENIAIYSIVNSLAELPDIDKVQFTIESEVQKKYWKDVSFNAAFDENLNYVETPN